MDEVYVEKSVYSSTLKIVVDMLNYEQKGTLLGKLANDISSIESSSNFDGSELMQNFVGALQRIKFRVGESQKAMKSDQSRVQQSCFVCIKCNIHIVPAEMDSHCPSCGSVKWLELTHF